MKRALFFLNTNKQIKELAKRLDKDFHSIVYKTFTTDAFDRKDDKKKILKDFKEDHFDILLSINCFTEGVDVPSVENAIFVASSGNEKEFIQRRGRVLRRYKDKSKAIIHDIIIIPPEKEKENRQVNIKLMSSEINRAKIFAEDSLNKDETESKISDRLNRYDLTPEDMSEVNYDE